MTRGEFAKYALLCPELLGLEKAIRKHSNENKNNADYCANEHWYSRYYEEGYGYRKRMRRLVGWEADIPQLKTKEAYDTCYDYLYDLLPDCTHPWGSCRG